MKLKYFLQLIILFFCIWFPNAYSQTISISKNGARIWAENKGKEIIEILSSSDESKYDRLDEILQNDVDLDYAAKFVVGKYWRQMTEKQKQHYLSLFNRYISATYKSYPLNLQEGDVKFEINKVLTDEKGAHIFCTIYIKALEENTDESSQGGINVTFLIAQTAGVYKVRDLKIQESSFLQTYRTRFYKMIHDDADDEIEWFLEDFESLIIENESNL